MYCIQLTCKTIIASPSMVKQNKSSSSAYPVPMESLVNLMRCMRLRNLDSREKSRIFLNRCLQCLINCCEGTSKVLLVYQHCCVVMHLQMVAEI